MFEFIRCALTNRPIQNPILVSGYICDADAIKLLSSTPLPQFPNDDFLTKLLRTLQAANSPNVTREVLQKLLLDPLTKAPIAIDSAVVTQDGFLYDAASLAAHVTAQLDAGISPLSPIDKKTHIKPTDVFRHLFAAELINYLTQNSDDTKLVDVNQVFANVQNRQLLLSLHIFPRYYYGEYSPEYHSFHRLNCTMLALSTSFWKANYYTVQRLKNEFNISEESAMAGSILLVAASTYANYQIISPWINKLLIDFRERQWVKKNWPEITELLPHRSPVLVQLIRMSKAMLATQTVILAMEELLIRSLLLARAESFEMMVTYTSLVSSAILAFCVTFLSLGLINRATVDFNKVQQEICINDSYLGGNLTKSHKRQQIERLAHAVITLVCFLLCFPQKYLQAFHMQHELLKGYIPEPSSLSRQMLAAFVTAAYLPPIMVLSAKAAENLTVGLIGITNQLSHRAEGSQSSEEHQEQFLASYSKQALLHTAVKLLLCAYAIFTYSNSESYPLMLGLSLALNVLGYMSFGDYAKPAKAEPTNYRLAKRLLLTTEQQNPSASIAEILPFYADTHRATTASDGAEPRRDLLTRRRGFNMV